MLKILPQTVSVTAGYNLGIRTFCWNYVYFIIHPHETVDELVLRIETLFAQDVEPEGVCLYVYFTSISPYVLEFPALRVGGSQVQWRKEEVVNKVKMRAWCRRMVAKRDRWLSSLRIKEDGHVYITN